jgi:hypothetical protein
MRAKGFCPLSLLLILTVSSGCDNVEWGGTDVVLRPPPPPPGALWETGREEGEEAPLEPLELGPLVYLVDRSDDPWASIVPVAELRDGDYLPPPDPAETPDLLQRFPLERWEEGTEFVLYSQNAPVGVLRIDGTAEMTEDLCLARPVGRGVVHLRPDAGQQDRFFALRRRDLPADPPFGAEYPHHEMTNELLGASVNVAQNIIATVGIPWPPSVSGIRRRIDPWIDGQGRRSLAASFVFGDDLQPGEPEPTGYSLFLLSAETEQGFRPVFSWYQPADVSQKAFPGFLAAHDLEGRGEPHLFLEVFGVESRWFAVLGQTADGVQLIYQDPCGVGPAQDAFRNHS